MVAKGIDSDCFLLPFCWNYYLEKGTTLIALVGATIGKTGYLTFDCSTKLEFCVLNWSLLKAN